MEKLMNQIFRITENEVYIDSLIIEPTWNCAKNCQGCYLETHNNQSEEIEFCELGNLVEAFLSTNSSCYSTNQISISVNEVGNHFSWDAAKIEEIIYTNFYYKNKEPRKDTKFHLTMYSPSTIGNYIEACKEEYSDIDIFPYFAAVDAIYFSNISEEEIGIIKNLRALNENIEIGWNCRPWHSYISPIVPGSKVINGIYSLADKSRKQPPIFRPGALPEKVVEDICYIDYTNWKKDWHNTTCSANISKFTVWPDGSVSGCPYIKQSDTGPATTWKGILANIVEASKSYDFNKCPMKEVYK
jgi:hypothetical protein